MGKPAEPPVRLQDNVDVSFRDVPYPVVPPLTRRGLRHEAVILQGVFWNRGNSVRVLVDTRCGKKDLTADRRSTEGFPLCKVCYPERGAAE